MGEAYIAAATRTAGGRRGGRLRGWHPADLGAVVLNDLVDRTGVDPARIEDVLMGCVMQAGEQAVNVGRGAVLASRLPESVPATTIDRQCGSSQQTLQFAAQAVMSGVMDMVIAAGVESMTRVPMNMPTDLPAANGFGHPKSPGQEARYPGVAFSQFTGAELVAKKYGLKKDELDEYSYQSHQRAIAATQAGAFKDEIVAIDGLDPEGGAVRHDVDEGIRFNVTLDGISSVKLLHQDGVVSAASASQICDGAAGVLVVSERALKEHNLTPLARIHHMSVMGHDPVIMLEAPLPATMRALDKVGMSIDDIDLFEVNEAFAPIPIAWLQATKADPDRMNVYGGAIALGHPLGATGAKLMTTLVHALRGQNKRYGLQTMCEGGGMANVTIVERL